MLWPSDDDHCGIGAENSTVTNNKTRRACKQTWEAILSWCVLEIYNFILQLYYEASWT